MTRSGRIRLALALGASSGFVEALVRMVTRTRPELHAAHKVPIDVLWVAPLMNAVLFVAVALVMGLVLRFAPERLRARDREVSLGVFTFLAVAVIGLATAVLHPAAVLLVAVGGAVSAARASAGRPATHRMPSPAALAGSLLLPVVGGIIAAASGPVAERSKLASLPDPAPDAPHVLVIMLDTVRWDSFQGDLARRLVPNLSGLVNAGISYDNAWSVTSWSLPSQATLLTGLDPLEHGADWPRLGLRPDVTTLAERFSSRGYATVAVSGNSSWVTPEYLGRGFLRFQAYVLEDVLRRTSIGRRLSDLSRAFSFYPAGRGKKARKVNDQFLTFLDDYPDRPFFAYLCYMDTNQALHHRKFNHYFRRQAPLTEVHAAYEEGLLELDAEVGRLLADLERRDLLDSTLIVVTSDHGESFGPEVARDRAPVGHGTSLYPEQTRVPLIVVPAAEAARGVRISREVSISQVPATIVALLGWDGVADEAQPMGDALPLATAAERDGPKTGTTGPTAPIHNGVLLTLRYGERDVRSVARDGWQYILDLTDGGSPTEEFLRFGPEGQSDAPPRAELVTLLETHLPGPVN